MQGSLWLMAVGLIAIVMALHASPSSMVEAKANLPSPLKVIYVDWRNIDWNAPQNTVRQVVDAGYNVIIIAFYLVKGPTDMAEAWASVSQSDQQSTMAYAHSKGAQVIVSAGGGTETPYSAIDGWDYGKNVAQWAVNNNLDGVDFDLENFNQGFIAPGLSGEATIQWVVDATNAARSIVGNDRLVTHAPQSPYFGKVGGGGANSWPGNGGGYTAVYQRAPTIDFFNTQFYNQGSTCYVDFKGLFEDSSNCGLPGTALLQVATYGIPKSKLTVGKPVYSYNAGNGYVDPGTLGGYLRQAQSQYNWNTGVMGWEWAGPNTASWIQTIYP